MWQAPGLLARRRWQILPAAASYKSQPVPLQGKGYCARQGRLWDAVRSSADIG